MSPRSSSRSHAGNSHQAHHAVRPRLHGSIAPKSGTLGAITLPTRQPTTRQPRKRTNTLSEQPSLAQIALNTYTELGEYAFVAYIVANAQHQHQEDSWRNHGYLVLADGSTIVHQDGHYQLHGANETAWQMPARMPAHQRPRLFNRPTPVFPWPDTDQVAEQLYQHIAHELGIDVNESLITPLVLQRQLA